MKKIILLPLLSIGFILLSSFIYLGMGTELALNAALPMADHKMKDVSGKMVSMGESKTNKGLLVIFSCNTCPYVKLSEKRIKEYSDYCQTNGIGCIVIKMCLCG
jgi:thioredoxin-related protein